MKANMYLKDSCKVWIILEISMGPLLLDKELKAFQRKFYIVYYKYGWFKTSETSLSTIIKTHDLKHLCSFEMPRIDWLNKNKAYRDILAKYEPIILKEVEDRSISNKTKLQLITELLAA